MFFRQVNIQNFRGIKALEIGNLNQINLLTGRNNCGKTSVLEAIFLLLGISNPQLAFNIHGFRGLILTDDDDFNYLFNNFNFDNEPILSCDLGEQKRTLKITPAFRTSNLFDSKKDNSLPSTSDHVISTGSESDKIIDGLNYNFKINGNEKFQSKINLSRGKGHVPGNYREKLSGTFLNHNTILSELADRLDNILVKKELGTIISALKEIEPNLEDIRIGSGGMVYIDTGGDTLVPINVMGDGIRRILAILSAISKKRDSILFIDEIENGLHYKTIEVLWKSILRAAIENNVQIFATTHSYECIVSFSKAYNEYSGRVCRDDEEIISLFRIERDKKGKHHAFYYPPETLAAGINNDFEVR